MNREIALRVLVSFYKEKSYINIVLNKELENTNLSREDKNFITRVVYGTVQYQLYLEYLLNPFITGKRVKTGIDGMSQYSIGGKTGTSEPINGSSDGYIASFLAISPIENTKIVLLVILNSPSGELHNGGEIAAPTAGNMLREILPYLGVETGNKDNGTQNTLSDNDLY